MSAIQLEWSFANFQSYRYVFQVRSKLVGSLSIWEKVDRQTGAGTILSIMTNLSLNTLRPRQNGRYFADDTFNRIFVNENVRISIKFSHKFVPKRPINNIPALVQIMAWRRPGDKPLTEPVMVSLLTRIRVTRPQWVNKVEDAVTVHQTFFLPQTTVGFCCYIAMTNVTLSW